MLENEFDQQTRNTQKKPYSQQHLIPYLLNCLEGGTSAVLAIGRQVQDLGVYDDRRNTLPVICSCSFMFSALQ